MLRQAIMIAATLSGPFSAHGTMHIVRFTLPATLAPVCGASGDSLRDLDSLFVGRLVNADTIPVVAASVRGQEGVRSALVLWDEGDYLLRVSRTNGVRDCGAMVYIGATASVPPGGARRDSTLYDIAGRKIVGKPAPGIYLTRGKKIVVSR